jgi:hypothetical protein
MAKLRRYRQASFGEKYFESRIRADHISAALLRLKVAQKELEQERMTGAIGNGSIR